MGQQYQNEENTINFELLIVKKIHQFPTEPFLEFSFQSVCRDQGGFEKKTTHETRKRKNRGSQIKQNHLQIEKGYPKYKNTVRGILVK